MAGSFTVTHGLPSQGSVGLGKDGDFPVLVAGAAQCPGVGSGTAVQPLWALLQGGHGLAQVAGGGTSSFSSADPSLGFGKVPQCCLHSPGNHSLLKRVWWNLNVFVHKTLEYV